MEYTVVRDVPEELVERAKRKCRALELSADKVELKFNRSLTDVTVIDIDEHKIIARFRLEPVQNRPAEQAREAGNASDDGDVPAGEQKELGEVQTKVRQTGKSNVERVHKAKAT